MAKRKTTTASAPAPTANPSPMSAGTATFAPPQAPVNRPAAAPRSNPVGQTGASYGGGNGTSRRPTHDEIARRAFEIWQAKGRPQGQDAAHWVQAERELTSSR